MLPVTVGFISVSDAAPLPRLGEVFFDVRGNSRSMRLSWYADTGVAVFSIWQAGMCTGTFRLPMGDLSRMMETLERGPSPQGRGHTPVSGASRGPERGRSDYPADEDEIGLLDSTSGAGRFPGADYGIDNGGPQRGARYPAADYRPAAASGDYERSGYDPAGYAGAGQGSADYG